MKILKDPRMLHASPPVDTMKFVSFMYKIGDLKSVPDSWKDRSSRKVKMEAGAKWV